MDVIEYFRFKDLYTKVIEFDPSNIVGKISDANMPDAISSNVTGNAATATKLATARTVGLTGDVTGSASFDGSRNVTITTTISDDSHNHTITNVDGLQTALNGKSSTSHNHTIANVDGLQAALNGKLASNANAVSATKLATARTIGGVSFNGTGNINLPGVNVAGNQNTSGNAATATTATNCSRQVVAGTGLSGGGALTANRTLNVTYGTAAGTACQGNDSRLASDRTRKTTVSSAAPSGGTDGDVWLKYI